MSSEFNKLAKKIVSEIRDLGFIEKGEMDKFIDLNRSEGREVIEQLISIEEDEEVKCKLMELLERKPYMYDPRLTLLMIWISFGVVIKEGFNPKGIV